MSFHVALPLAELLALLGKDVNLDEVLVPGEKPQTFEERCPAEAFRFLQRSILILFKRFLALLLLLPIVHNKLHLFVRA